MPEHAPQHHSPEHLSHHSPEKSEETNRSTETTHKHHETKSHDLVELRKEVTSEAVSGKELSPAELGKQENNLTLESPKQLKKVAFQKTMSRVRSQLKLPSRIGSKIIHQPTIDKLSSVGAQTFARPGSLLSGGLFALVGSSILLFMARRYGFSYNYLMIFGLFIAGWLVGLIVEGTVKLFRRRA